MRTLSLSSEICKKIVELMAHRQHDLVSLCLVCKAFQREAEVKLYMVMMLSEPRQTMMACDTLARNERLAQHVRSFMYNQDLYQPRHPEHNITLGRDFWTAIQRALIAAINLESLLISDSTYSNSWILDTPNIRFRLKDLKARLTWDGPFLWFLERQHTLQSLHFYDSADEITEHVQPGCLPELRVFDGTLMIGIQLIPSNLTHIQLVVDCDPAPIDAFTRFGALRKTLRSLSLLDLPDNISQRTLDSISRVLPDLRHLGLFPYPMMERHDFHRCLMRMHNLQVIELDLGRWVPQPLVIPAQRVLAAELQTYCPSLKMVVFWIGNMKCRWVHSPQYFWQSQITHRQYPQNSNLWCIY